MTPYSQKDPRWASHFLGNSRLTIKAAGCVITSLGMMVNKNPDEINTILRNGKAFPAGNPRNSAEGAIVIWQPAARLLDLDYDPSSTRPVKTPCLALTDHYAKTGYPTHFFIYLGNNRIIDPLDGQEKNNPYRIIGYRNLSPKENTFMTEEQVRYMLFQVMHNGWCALNDYKSPDDSSIHRESDEIVDKYKTFFDKFVQGGDWCADQKFHQWHDEMVAHHPEYKPQ